jgi:hypothetical protein
MPLATRFGFLYHAAILQDKYSFYYNNLPFEKQKFLPESFPDPFGSGYETSSIGVYNFHPAIPVKHIHDKADWDLAEEIYQQLYSLISSDLHFLGTLISLLELHGKSIPRILYLLYSLSPQDYSGLCSVLRSSRWIRDPESLTSFLQDLDNTSRKIFADAHQLLFECEMGSFSIDNY